MSDTPPNPPGATFAACTPGTRTDPGESVTITPAQMEANVARLGLTRVHQMLAWARSAPVGATYVTSTGGIRVERVR